MARGNIFLGMGRGSIGDVTFYRADGQQLSRVRNRRPKNPKSQAQLYQRAIMASVIKAYQAGKAIFDHSFQGYSVGAQCQRQFMSLNTKMLRQLVATDINTPISTNDQKARVVAPGANTPVANPFIISRGSYQQSLFAYDEDGESFKIPEVNDNEKVSEYAERVNLIAGDIYTIVLFAEKTQIAYQSPRYDDALASLNYCDFGWVRCIVKSGLSSVDTALSKMSDLFEFQSSGGAFDVSRSHLDNAIPGLNMGMDSFIDSNSEDYTFTGAYGVIRSRLDQDLRSDSEMHVLYGASADDMFGIASDYILDEWAAGTTSVGNSELILEGGNA